MVSDVAFACSSWCCPSRRLTPVHTFCFARCRLGLGGRGLQRRIGALYAKSRQVGEARRHIQRLSHGIACLLSVPDWFHDRSGAGALLHTHGAEQQLDRQRGRGPGGFPAAGDYDHHAPSSTVGISGGPLRQVAFGQRVRREHQCERTTANGVRHRRILHVQFQRRVPGGRGHIQHLRRHRVALGSVHPGRQSPRRPVLPQPLVARVARPARPNARDERGIASQLQTEELCHQPDGVPSQRVYRGAARRGRPAGQAEHAVGRSRLAREHAHLFRDRCVVRRSP